jgi:hypothetical protein
MESNGNKAVVAIVTLVVGLAVGGGVGYAAAANMNNDDNSSHSSVSMKSTTTKAAGLRSTLVSFGTEHMDLTYAAVASALNGTKSAEADQTSLIQNGKDLAAAVGSVYGDDAQATFEKVWTLHLTQFVNYAVASSKGDEAGKQTALSTIDSQYTHPLAAYLAKANPNLPESALYAGLKEHVDMTAVMIDNEAKGDFSTATMQREMGIKHLEGLMSTLAAGIVKQYPNKF